MTSQNIPPRFPQDPFEEYQEAKAALVSCAMNFARAVEAEENGADNYWKPLLVKRAATVQQLRDWILREP